ncbi:origin recognition complex subunit 1 isoform X2 [Gouania willdenowi]|uniref:origin recognition complex subunit 1 isoform X2 n=1 Tax=Gouania willdenowi TaxID=441366 RepID=UPI001056938D|nr:origin recognition complex subunit 1 isoform X2 [Gouania willdenowi]
MKYSSRLRVRRVYEWRGKPVGFNRRLKTCDYSRLSIRVEGLPSSTLINTGQHVLIEGDDQENPYVAKVLRMFSDVSGTQKTAEVQWMVRVSEVPPDKLKLLRRDPHPQEIFLYQSRSCQQQVHVESFLRPVQVVFLDGSAPFPNSQDEDVFYVKFSWDSKTFRELSSAPTPPPEPLLSPSPSRSPPTTTLASRNAPRLAVPDPAVLLRAGAAASGIRSGPRTASAGKRGVAEAESLHSATKLSASKCLSARRRTAAGRTPGVRKKLQLNGLEDEASMEDDVLELLLKDEMHVSFTPSRKGSAHLKMSSVILDKLSLSDVDGSPPGGGEEERATTPSRRKEVKAARDPPLGVLVESDAERSPLLRATPRSSKRKSAMMVSARVRRQLNLLTHHADLHSDGDDEDAEFVPSKKDEQSSSDEEEEAVSEEELEVKKSRHAAPRTPRSKRKPDPSRRTPRKSAPGTPRTPNIPRRSRPVLQPANVLEEARARLHVSSVPESLPCREQEFQDIYSFVESKIIDGTGGCMYISGVPGTGKTATVQEVIRCLQHAAHIDEIPSFVFIEINGMKMTDPHQAYVQILQKMTGQKATAEHAAALLDRRFSACAARKECTVLLVDELDLLWTRKQNVMYNLFDWPTRRQARLVVLTIANTMDLPERVLINRVASRLGLTRLSFQPYSFKQLQTIITSRLNKVRAFENDALQLVSRKVAALSGDARRCLDICRRATEICEQSPGGVGAALVGMSHVMEALDEMFSSSYVTAIKCASVQEQLFLRAIIAEFRRLGLEEATFQQVLVQLQALCLLEGTAPVGVSEALAVCQRLGACRLLLLESSRQGIGQRVRLNVSQDDVLYALRAD